MMRPLLASGYGSIPDRKSDLDKVRTELNAVINAMPTQLHPDERERYLKLIMEDLEDKENAPWTQWPEDLFLLALTVVKTLSRNPMGSETLLETAHMATIIHHTALPFPPPPSPFSHPPPPRFSPLAHEALRIIANLLVLHPAGRNRFAKAGGARAIAKALASIDSNGEYIDQKDEGSSVALENLFLLARIGFLVTLERKDAAVTMVDKEDVLDSLVHHLHTTSVTPSAYSTLVELLKLANNLIQYYPHTKPAASSCKISDTDESWDERFDVLLYPVLCIFHTIPFARMGPPISQAIHLLFAIPFLPRLLPTWHSVPLPDTPAPGASTASTVKAFLNRFSNMTLSEPPTSPPKTGNGDGQNRRKLSSSTSDTASTRSKSPSPPVGRRRSHTVPWRKDDPEALPRKLLEILEEFVREYLPRRVDVDDQEWAQGLILDEHLPPLLMLMARGASGSEPVRAFLKQSLLPPDLDRSAESGPLEEREGALGTLLVLMRCTSHPNSRDTAGELLWAICNSDASTLTAEIGYGNAAGLLFKKGISGVPQGKIEEIPTSARSSITQDDRDAITALKGVDDGVDPMEGMTEAEKEQEAERLFVLFAKLHKNPVISTQNADGSKQSLKEAMQGKYSEVDAGWAEKERKEQEEQDQREEEEAIKELEAYKNRLGRK